MEWITIYITGTAGFKKEISRKLEHSSLHYMPGYMGNVSDDYDMYWLDKDIELQLFKEAIGAKTIWKYRIRFYETLEKFIASQYHEANTTLTQKEITLMNEMRKPANTGDCKKYLGLHSINGKGGISLDRDIAKINQ